MLLHFCEWLEHLPFIVAISSSVVLSAIVEVAHYAGFFLLVGSIAIVDLRVLGLAARRQTPAALASQLFPWMCTGLVSAFPSGFIMFAGDASDFARAKWFGIKMLVLLAALVAGIIVQWGVPRWDRAPSMPAGAKLVAFVSLALWISAILVAVEVPAISGVG
jgi:Family of unknown function (DUF6644)